MSIVNKIGLSCLIIFSWLPTLSHPKIILLIANAFAKRVYPFNGIIRLVISRIRLAWKE